MSTVTRLRHNKVDLALHALRPGAGRPLLLLHGLGERTPPAAPPVTDRWPGPVHGLDFTGHGASTVPAGGGYTSEVLMADVDAALEFLGPSTVVGRGLGAYIGLLAAGARPDAVLGAILADGPGLHGGGSSPGSPVIPHAGADPGPPDPLALAELARDIRPPDYATSFARQATHLSPLASPIAVAAVVRPPWLEAILGEPGVADMSFEDALDMYAAP